MTYKKYIEQLNKHSARLGTYSAMVFLGFSFAEAANRVDRPVLSSICAAIAIGFLVALGAYFLGLWGAPNDDAPEVIPAPPSPVKPVPSTPVPAVPMLEAKPVKPQEDPVVPVETKPIRPVDRYLVNQLFKIGSGHTRIPDTVDPDHLNRWLMLVQRGEREFSAHMLDSQPPHLKVSRNIKSGPNAGTLLDWLSEIGAIGNPSNGRYQLTDTAVKTYLRSASPTPTAVMYQKNRVASRGDATQLN